MELISLTMKDVSLIGYLLSCKSNHLFKYMKNLIHTIFFL